MLAQKLIVFGRGGYRLPHLLLPIILTFSPLFVNKKSEKLSGFAGCFGG